MRLLRAALTAGMSILLYDEFDRQENPEKSTP
jgi:hypothetical protein